MSGRVVQQTLNALPWWTPADRAELDLQVHELVVELFEHRDGCEVCAAGYPPCPFVIAAIERVAGWREDRILRSRAAWLRARQNEHDQVVAGAESS